VLEVVGAVAEVLVIVVERIQKGVVVSVDPVVVIRGRFRVQWHDFQREPQNLRSVTQRPDEQASEPAEVWH
jgi:hypothetical protein